MFNGTILTISSDVDQDEQMLGLHERYHLKVHTKSKKDGKDQDTIQSSSTPDPGYHMGK